MNKTPDLPEPPTRPARRASALPFVLLGLGVCLLAAIGVALVVLLAPRPPEVVVPGPVVTTRIGWVTASPEEVEVHLSMPVEERLGRVAGAVAIRTEARVGECFIEVEFASGTKESAALASVRRALDGVTLPEDAGRPEVEMPAGPGDRTVLLVFSGDESQRVLQKGVRAARERLLRDPGIRLAEVIGAPREIMLVQVDENALARYDLSPAALVEAIREGIRTEPAADALGQLVVRTHGEAPVYLGDVARVMVSQDTPTSAALDEDGPVILIRAVFRAGADAPLLRGDVSDLQAALPPGVGVEARSADESDDHLPDNLPGIDPLSHPDPARQPLTFDVQLEDGQDPVETIEDLRNVLRSVDGVEFVTPGPAPSTPELRLVINRERAAAMGIPPDSITGQFALFSTGQEVGRSGGLPVVVRIGEPPRRSDDLAGLLIRSPSGEWVPLRALASLELAAPPATIRRVSGRRVVTLGLMPAEGADREKVLASAREAVRRRMEQGD